MRRKFSASGFFLSAWLSLFALAPFLAYAIQRSSINVFFKEKLDLMLHIWLTWNNNNRICMERESTVCFEQNCCFGFLFCD